MRVEEGHAIWIDREIRMLYRIPSWISLCTGTTLVGADRVANALSKSPPNVLVYIVGVAGLLNMGSGNVLPTLKLFCVRVLGDVPGELSVWPRRMCPCTPHSQPCEEKGCSLECGRTGSE